MKKVRLGGNKGYESIIREADKLLEATQLRIDDATLREGKEKMNHLAAIRNDVSRVKAYALKKSIPRKEDRFLVYGRFAYDVYPYRSEYLRMLINFMNLFMDFR